MAMRTAASPLDQLPDSLLVQILRQASGISKQQQQHQQQEQDDQPFLISTRKQQCYLCGIFTLVSHRWRLAALSLCTSLDISLISAQNTKLLSSWLLHNGSNEQHLRLWFETDPLPLLSTLPICTPQLKSLRASGLAYSDKAISSEAAAAWAALSSLTSLEVDTMLYLHSAVKQIPNLLELSTTELSMTDQLSFYRGSVPLIMSIVPQLQVLRFPALQAYRYDCCTKQELDALSRMQQLRQVDGMCLDSADLVHPFVMEKCYPSLQIRISASERAGDIAEWLHRGGGKQVTKLLACSKKSELKPSISQWSGIPALRSLELIHLHLSPGLQQLRRLTQLTHLKMAKCSPDIHSLNQLPPGLCSLSLDNLRSNAALHEQQQQQVSSTSTPQLPHLTRLVLIGDSSLDSAGRIVTGFTNLQQLVLTLIRPSALSMLDPFSQLTSLSSLTIPSLGSEGVEGASLLTKLTGLQQLEVSGQFMTPPEGLEVAAALGHLPAFTGFLSHLGGICASTFSGGMLQVRRIPDLGKHVWKG
jgi:hypothetical protein